MTLEEIRAFFAGDTFALKRAGITIDALTENGARLSLPVTPDVLNAQGFVQGGAIFTLCDTAFAVAANAVCAPTVSTGASISYLRPGTGPCLTAEAELISRQRSSCLYGVSVYDQEHELVAYATVSGLTRKA